MPARIARPCRKARCPGTTTDRQGYCSEHQESNWKGWQDRKGSSTQRGYGSKWQKLRKVILERDNHLCQECLKTGRLQQASLVDHMTPKAQGGTDAPENLQSLCYPCHKVKTATERQ